jgi:hypothetical protein
MDTHASTPATEPLPGGTERRTSTGLRALPAPAFPTRRKTVLPACPPASSQRPSQTQKDPHPAGEPSPARRCSPFLCVISTPLAQTVVFPFSCLGSTLNIASRARRLRGIRGVFLRQMQFLFAWLQRWVGSARASKRILRRGETRRRGLRDMSVKPSRAQAPRSKKAKQINHPTLSQNPKP